MSGHSKWAQIKHKKAKVDAQRGKLFTKVIREITIAARMGGGDPDHNPRLRIAIDKAKETNMPWENIERAIKRGTGELEGVDYVETVFEGFGPEGIALLIKVLTDNKNRTAGEIRHILTRYGGHLGAPGSVAWQFEEKGIIYLSKDKVSEDTVLEVALQKGAEDIRDEGDTFALYCTPKDFAELKNAFQERGIEILDADITMIPQSSIRIEDERTAERILRLVDALEENDDVQKVYANFDIPDEVLQAIAARS
ncbi:MAG TPA: YebC/PmpR family DNA-binding transcriptional regulator [Candidatus Hydrothermia bacterium]|nr:YebC/PmpR family DNA-binding transcriptional regulator [Candidatus Hydrothermae bacterium]MDD3649057.1 YebC/PmpR family DNA-binding transcriptional regulator [Candidatus Hydrothermia bacterium]MDD5572998.1 YebC/PmpR family DNA-binding transcriptional regulator [Candidatus Hydrothermia bacterium]HOK22996.1 YebC/PmpR family DNA-binding transcriptional regulator [Candidatus Hydrothermia bacterium]HOL23744.1 YebC/PmpR family DNA-binding transcriptional regulator [Candidatus Hydrothermia bacteriu